ncbi:MAG TPA: hypothetical protein VKA96_07240 [Solirubrobacteraceae bacterium]|nr:hypothetical protein [Solirubrobacteraceae bacterium]
MAAWPDRGRQRVIVVLLTAALAPAACGGGGSQQLQPIDRSRLSSQLTEVRDAAGRGDRSAARQALDDFVGEVRRLRRAGTLDGPTAAALLLGAQRARDRLEVELAPPAAQPVAPAPQPQVQPEPAQPKPPKKPKPEAEPPKEQKKQQENKDEGGSSHDHGDKGGKKH